MTPQSFNKTFSFQRAVVLEQEGQKPAAAVVRVELVQQLRQLRQLVQPVLPVFGLAAGPVRLLAVRTGRPVPVPELAVSAGRLRGLQPVGRLRGWIRLLRKKVGDNFRVLDGEFVFFFLRAFEWRGMKMSECKYMRVFIIIVRSLCFKVSR